MKMKNEKTIMIVSVVIILVVLIGLIISGTNSYNTLQKYNTATEELNSNKVVLASTKNELVTTQENLRAATEKLTALQDELDIANTTISDLKGEEYDLVYLGDFKITHYCCERYAHVCGGGNGITATGTEVTAGRTVAVDPSVIPYGTNMYIEGYGFRIAEDCGGGVNGRHIDVAVETHAGAIQMGTGTRGVWILVKKQS